MDWGLTLGSVYFNSIDIIVFALAVICGITESVNGFADAFSRRAGYLAGFFTALMFSKIVAEVVAESFSLSTFWSVLIAFVVLFLVGYGILRLIGGILETALESIGLGALDSLLGFLWGVLELAVVFAVILYVLSLQQMFDVSRYLDSSQFVIRFVRPVVPKMIGWISTRMGGAHV